MENTQIQKILNNLKFREGLLYKKQRQYSQYRWPRKENKALDIIASQPSLTLEEKRKLNSMLGFYGYRKMKLNHTMRPAL